jgi:aspartyl-tRNA(Asn)/glutamyl-tRNA(Gln) amidotransferase subunit A
LPAISVPAARDSNGLPLGLQLIGRPFEEETIYSFAKILEESANFKNIENQWWIK